MNIFILDTDPVKAAEYHCDKHVCKMILEAGQMLCTAHWVKWLEKLGKSRSDFRIVRDMQKFLYENVPRDKQPPWKITHMNHPCSIWTRESLENYLWHVNLGLSLCCEYTGRYGGKTHKSLAVHKWLLENHPPGLEPTGQTPFSICMRPDYKISNDPVECYREYYLRDKVRFAKWKTGKIPGWWHVQ